MGMELAPLCSGLIKAAKTLSVLERNRTWQGTVPEIPETSAKVYSRIAYIRVKHYMYVWCQLNVNGSMAGFCLLLSMDMQNFTTLNIGNNYGSVTKCYIYMYVYRAHVIA